MRIAFVGIEKDWDNLKKRDYINKFIKHHLELPWYYCTKGRNDVDIVSDFEWGPIESILTLQDMQTKQLEVIRYDKFLTRDYDVVIHWRKWFEDLYKPEAVNVINSQDHSYSSEWLQKVNQATKEEKLYGILCFPTWHETNLTGELNKLTHRPFLLPGVTLGVDTQVYQPNENKNRHGLLWASDIGRGLFNGGFLNIAADLFKRNTRFKSNVCYPDYGEGVTSIGHPAITLHKNLDNGPELWNLFNDSGFLPYTSTFNEPSSRAHRQAMAAGMIVLYPPNRGTPSELLTDNVDGFVRPVSEWVDIIARLSEDKEEFDRISKNAREHALKENWEVQAQRFNELFKGIRNDS